MYFLLCVNSSMCRSQFFPCCIYQNYIWYYITTILNRTIIVLRNFKTLGVDLSILNGNFTSAWNFLFGGGGAKMIITIFQYSICRPSSLRNSFVSDFTCCCVLDDDLKIFYSYLWISIKVIVTHINISKNFVIRFQDVVWNLVCCVLRYL